MNHKKIDRMLGLTEQWRLPLVFYAEGGGGRPADTTGSRDDRSRRTIFRAVSPNLSGLVPVVAWCRCYASPARRDAGCCDGHHRDEECVDRWAGRR